MRLDVQAAPSLPTATFTAVAVTAPFDPSDSALATLDAAAVDALRAEARRVEFDAKIGTAVTAYAGGRWFALIGAGASPQPTDYRRVGSKLVQEARRVQADTAAVIGTNSTERVRFTVEGAYLTGYAFDSYKTETPPAPQLSSVTVVADDAHAAGAKLGVDIAEAVCVARDVANEHPGRCTPSFLAQRGSEIAETYGMMCTVRGEKQLEAEGFNLLLAVGRGSVEDSQLVHLVYRPKGEVRKRIAIVGKGVTYDSGGYSMKPSASQVNMHLDMGGAAAVLGAAEAVGRTQPEGVEVHFIVPTVENLVSGNAFKLNEIITGYNGTTVEILNTDAEGRLILADALAFAVEQEPDEIVDLATLTGACVVALGNESAGLFSNDDGLAARISAAASAVDESMWRMPLTERIEAQLKSDFADTKNVGTRWGGAISAALFLRKFIGDTAWAHIDIAGPGMMDSPWEYICKGGTGFGVIALQAYVADAGRAS